MEAGNARAGCNVEHWCERIARRRSARLVAVPLRDCAGAAFGVWAAEEGEPMGTTAAESLRVVVIDDDEDEGPG
jgi:hypothetical protein